MTAVGADSGASSAATHGDAKCIETVCEVDGRRLVEFGWGGRDYYDYLWYTLNSALVSGRLVSGRFTFVSCRF